MLTPAAGCAGVEAGRTYTRALRGDLLLQHPRLRLHPQKRAQVVECFLRGRDDVLGEDKIEGLELTDTQSGEKREMGIEGLFIAIGHKPNTEVFKEYLEIDDKGYLEVTDHTLSNVEGVFVAGDVHDHRYRQAITAAGDGCRAAIDAERWLVDQAEAAQTAPGTSEAVSLA